MTVDGLLEKLRATDVPVELLAIAETLVDNHGHIEQTSNEIIETFIVSDALPELAPEALHGITGKILKAIEPHTEADAVAVLFSFFVALGVMLGSNIHWMIGGTPHPLRVWVVLVGSTSKGRKGTSWGAIKSLLELVFEDFKEHVNTGLSSGEGLIFAVRDAVTKSETDRKTGETQEIVLDAGVEDKRMVVKEEEFGRTLKAMMREGNTLSAVLRQAWDMGSDDLLNVMTKTANKSTGAHVGIIGHVTRDELLRYLENTETANGFANRFVWLLVKRSKVLPFGGSPDQRTLEEIAAKLKSVLAWAGSTNGLVRWSQSGREAWAVVYESLSEGTSGLTGAILSRAEAQVIRLAGLYAVLDKTLEVSDVHLRAALALWEYAEASAKHIFGDKFGDPIADAIFHALEVNRRLTKTQVSEFLGRNASAARISNAVNLLVRENRVKIVKGDKNGGRIAEFLELVR